MNLNAELRAKRLEHPSEIAVIPTGACIGAEVKNVDLKNLDGHAFAELRKAWLDYSVLLFRDQKLGDQDLISLPPLR